MDKSGPMIAVSESRIGDSADRIRDTEARIRDTEARIRDSEARIRDSEAKIRDIVATVRDTEARARVKVSTIRGTESRIKNSDAKLRDLGVRKRDSAADVHDSGLSVKDPRTRREDSSASGLDPSDMVLLRKITIDVKRILIQMSVLMTDIYLRTSVPSVNMEIAVLTMGKGLDGMMKELRTVIGDMREILADPRESVGDPESLIELLKDIVVDPDAIKDDGKVLRINPLPNCLNPDGVIYIRARIDYERELIQKISVFVNELFVTTENPKASTLILAMMMMDILNLQMANLRDMARDIAIVITTPGMVAKDPEPVEKSHRFLLQSLGALKACVQRERSILEDPETIVEDAEGK